MFFFAFSILHARQKSRNDMQLLIVSSIIRDLLKKVDFQNYINRAIL